MTRSTFRRDDAELSVFDSVDGCPVVFQHGLGGDNGQVVENFPDGPDYRRLTVECRAQGHSTPGNVRPFSIAMFANDILAVCDARGIERFVMGGISMGAAIALHIAHHHPERVAGLVLARPAWLFDPAPENMRPYAKVAEVLRLYPREEAGAAFEALPIAAQLRRDARDNLASLLKFIDRPNAELTADLLSDIAHDGPGVTMAQAAALDVPTLVIGHGVDHAHPLAYAQQLAATIPDARMVEIAPKATDKTRHVSEFRSALHDFLRALHPIQEKTA
ncbi:alpha/beta fold hydrolase [Kaistia terrae]|uniref:Alpha/beta fold hydrolase n=1 Tax=Kaistia terrae TaxID=537017 RepID=A0ABW0PS09_9HYPH|nr:alpha/beta hydrolase [Kaistia terrae]MCX5577592.1 alpha/beta hydrolase [Kaistia terrae]